MGIKKGDIYYADLTPVVGSEQGGVRPVLIIQNNMGNQFSPTVIAAAITSRKGKRALPTHIRLGDELQGLHGNSMVLPEQIRTIDRSRLNEYIGRLNANTMHEIDHAIAVSFGLDDILGQHAVPGDEAERQEG